jgi:hypothetical protein
LRNWWKPWNASLRIANNLAKVLTTDIPHTGVEYSRDRKGFTALQGIKLPVKHGRTDAGTLTH